jgi:hypothetical protein
MRDRKQVECQKMATAAGWTMFMMLAALLQVVVASGAWMLFLYL